MLGVVRRRLCGALALLAPGCGLISGLDSLAIVDASVNDASDASSDASSLDVVDDACEFVPPSPKCPAACPNGCCSDLDAGALTCTCVEPAQFECFESNDCKDSGGDCCISGITVVSIACPTIVTASFTRTTCAAGCPPGELKLCASDLACGSGHCRMAATAVDGGTLGICVDF